MMKGDAVPGLADVEHVDTVGPGLPQVWLHVDLQVLAADVALGGEQHLDILGRGVEDGREVGGGHLRGVGCVVAKTKECRGMERVLWNFEVGAGEIDRRRCAA